MTKTQRLIETTSDADNFVVVDDDVLSLVGEKFGEPTTIRLDFSLQSHKGTTSEFRSFRRNGLARSLNKEYTISDEGDSFMRGFVPRLLMLSCSLLLVLPPGWCCIFAVQTVREDSTKTDPCCPSCCGKSNTSTPTPSPAPDKPTRCPCADRQSTAPDTAKAFAVDLSVVAVLLVVDRTPTEFPASAPAATPPFLFSSPQLLHCVWLC